MWHLVPDSAGEGRDPAWVSPKKRQIDCHWAAEAHVCCSFASQRSHATRSKMDLWEHLERQTAAPYPGAVTEAVYSSLSCIRRPGVHSAWSVWLSFHMSDPSPGLLAQYKAYLEIMANLLYLLSWHLYDVFA